MECVKDMINRLCPKGVKRVKLADCLEYEQPTKYQVSSKDYIDKGTPVLTAGQTFILGYTDETNGIYRASKEKPVIIFDDFTTSFHWVDFDFKVKSSAMKMLTPCNEEANFRFVYYAMKCIKYETLEHSRQWISTYSQFEIPLPPLEIQNRIVEVLDKMTTLTAELEAELEARKQQYEYYRNKLLSFNEIGGGIRQVTWKKISEIGIVMRGKRLTKKMLSEENKYPVYHGGLSPIGKYSMKNRDANTVMIINVGASAGTVGFCNEDFWSSDGCFCLNLDNSIMPKYAYHALAIKQHHIQSRVRKAGIPTLDSSAVEDIDIPVPSMEEQERIVSILDRFEALTTDLQNGLPAEIEARHQQYEYYRNKLLTFDKVA